MFQVQCSANTHCTVANYLYIIFSKMLEDLNLKI